MLLSGEPGPRRSQVSLILHKSAVPLDFILVIIVFQTHGRSTKSPAVQGSSAYAQTPFLSLLWIYCFSSGKA